MASGTSYQYTSDLNYAFGLNPEHEEVVAKTLHSLALAVKISSQLSSHPGAGSNNSRWFNALSDQDKTVLVENLGKFLAKYNYDWDNRALKKLFVKRNAGGYEKGIQDLYRNAKTLYEMSESYSPREYHLQWELAQSQNKGETLNRLQVWSRSKKKPQNLMDFLDQQVSDYKNSEHVSQFLPSPQLQQLDKDDDIQIWEASAAINTLREQTEGKKIVTLVGFSADYKDPKELKQVVREKLSTYDPSRHVVNIGLTDVGVGELYPLAKELGFETAGVVSGKVQEYLGEGSELKQFVSDYVDYPIIVEDVQWGGYVEGTNKLCATSRSMVDVSDSFLVVGGGPDSADEVYEGLKQGKPAEIFYLERAVASDRANAADILAERLGVEASSMENEWHELKIEDGTSKPDVNGSLPPKKSVVQGLQMPGEAPNNSQNQAPLNGSM